MCGRMFKSWVKSVETVQLPRTQAGAQPRRRERSIIALRCFSNADVWMGCRARNVELMARLNSALYLQCCGVSARVAGPCGQVNCYSTVRGFCEAKPSAIASCG